MLRSIWFFGCLLVGWGSPFGIGLAQGTLPLRVQTERLQKNREAERQAIAGKNPTALAEAYYQYGRTYVFAGDYRASQGYFLKALQLLEPRGDSNELSRIYVRLSENEGRLGRSGDAMRYARLALTAARRIGSLMALGRAYGVMAHLHEERWDAYPRRNRVLFDSARAYYRRKAGVFRTLNDTLGMAEANLELGTLLTKVNDPQSISYLENALRLVTILHRDRIKVNVLLHLSSAYRTFGKRQLAFQTLRAAGRLYVENKVDEYDTILGLEEAYVRYYRSTGQWNEAFKHQEQANRLITNQLRSDREATIARLNVEYETEKKEALLRAQNNQLTLRTENLRTQQRFTWATSALFVGAAGMSLVFFRLYRKNGRISRRNEELVKEQNHRVKNNLQVVSSLLSLQANRLTDDTARQAVEESRLRVQSMAILHRRLYDGEVLAAVDVDEFVREVTREVLNTFGYSFLSVQYAIDQIYLSADKATPLGLILTELVTNACKYAFPGQDEPALSINCRWAAQRLRLEVVDNGPGMGGAELVLAHPDDLLPPRNRSFGMMLIQTQVAQLHGTGGFSAPADGGTRFTLAFNP